MPARPVIRRFTQPCLRALPGKAVFWARYSARRKCCPVGLARALRLAQTWQQCDPWRLCARHWRGTKRSIAMSDVVSPAEVAEKLTDHWSPRVIAEVDESYVKVAKVKGVLAWHSHAEEDELFLVLKGKLRIEMEDRTVTLH